LLFAVIAVVLAQDRDNREGGCCVFAGKNFTNEINCTSAPVILIPKGVGIQSFYCTERYSCAILLEDRIQELVDCGDTVPETTSLTGIPADRVTIGECLDRRCCSYTKEDKSGDEFCINGNDVTPAEIARVQTNGTFRVIECVLNWRASLTVHGRAQEIQVLCGETVDLPPNTRITKLVTTACSGSAAIDGDEGDFSTDEFAATADQFDNTFAADQAVDDVESYDQFVDVQLDQAVGDNFETFDDESFVGDAASADQFDQAVDDVESYDQFVDVQLDQAVGDNFETFDDDSFVSDAASADQFESTFAADQAVDQFTDAQFDQAVGDNFETFDDDSFVGDAQLDQAVADMAVDEEFVDGSYETGLDEQFDQFADQ